MSAGRNRGGRPRGALGPEGMRELRSLEIVDAAAELESVDAMLVHVLRRVRIRRAHLAAVYKAEAGPAATPLSDIIDRSVAA